MKDPTDKNIILAILYFIVSTIITWWFIAQGAWLYQSEGRMHLSMAIAGAVWAVQIAAVFLFLPEKALFLRRIGFVCFIGSCLLLPYCLELVQPFFGMFSGFMYSLIIAVLAMLIMYISAIRKTGLSMKWLGGWLICLAVAITLQITVVFRVG